MGDVLTHHDICEQFFANREPSLGEWRELRAAGVPLDALCRPEMVLAGDLIVDGPHRFGFTAEADAAAQGRAFLIAVTHEGDRFIDIAAWQPARKWLGLWLGSGWALGQGGIDDPRLGPVLPGLEPLAPPRPVTLGGWSLPGRTGRVQAA